jgi:hypothetical protein
VAGSGGPDAMSSEGLLIAGRTVAGHWCCDVARGVARHIEAPAAALPVLGKQAEQEVVGPLTLDSGVGHPEPLSAEADALE